MTLKRKKTAKAKAARALKDVDTFSDLAVRLSKRLAVTEYLLEFLLGNDMANQTPDGADHIATLIAKVAHQRFPRDAQSTKIACAIAARALDTSKTIRATMGGMPQAMQ